MIILGELAFLAFAFFSYWLDCLTFDIICQKEDIFIVDKPFSFLM